MSSSDLETLCAYRSCLVKFLRYTSGTHDFDAEYMGHRGALIKDLERLRTGTLVAGVNAGASFETMTDLLKTCHESFPKMFRPTSAKDGSEQEWLTLEIELLSRLRQLGELIADCESRQSKALSLTRDATPRRESETSNLSETQKAVLSIIKAQRKGKGIDGKGIIKQLKAQGIDLAESSLRKHVLPSLKEHGVVNHRAAGGYLIP